MEVKAGDHIYLIAPTIVGKECCLCIAKDGVQVGNPDLDPNKLAKLILELKTVYMAMI